MAGRAFRIGDAVLVKLGDHPAWPSRIVDPADVGHQRSLLPDEFVCVLFDDGVQYSVIPSGKLRPYVRGDRPENAHMLPLLVSAYAAADAWLDKKAGGARVRAQPPARAAPAAAPPVRRSVVAPVFDRDRLCLGDVVLLETPDRLDWPSRIVHPSMVEHAPDVRPGELVCTLFHSRESYVTPLHNIKQYTRGSRPAPSERTVPFFEQLVGAHVEADSWIDRVAVVGGGRNFQTGFEHAAPVVVDVSHLKSIDEVKAGTAMLPKKGAAGKTRGKRSAVGMSTGEQHRGRASSRVRTASAKRRESEAAAAMRDQRSRSVRAELQSSAPAAVSNAGLGTFDIGDVVLVKLRNSPRWPARVVPLAELNPAPPVQSGDVACLLFNEDKQMTVASRGQLSSYIKGSRPKSNSRSYKQLSVAYVQADEWLEKVERAVQSYGQLGEGPIQPADGVANVPSTAKSRKKTAVKPQNSEKACQRADTKGAPVKRVRDRKRDRVPSAKGGDNKGSASAVVKQQPSNTKSTKRKRSGCDTADSVSTPKRKFEVGEVVLYEMEGYPAWPARIVRRSDVRPRPPVRPGQAVGILFNDNNQHFVIDYQELRPYVKGSRPMNTSYFSQLSHACTEADEWIRRVEDGEKPRAPGLVKRAERPDVSPAVSKRKLCVGDVVLYEMLGYPAWPSHIVQPSDVKLSLKLSEDEVVGVFFNDDKQFYVASSAEVRPYVKGSKPMNTAHFEQLSGACLEADKWLEKVRRGEIPGAGAPINRDGDTDRNDGDAKMENSDDMDGSENIGGQYSDDDDKSLDQSGVSNQHSQGEQNPRVGSVSAKARTVERQDDAARESKKRRLNGLQVKREALVGGPSSMELEKGTASGSKWTSSFSSERSSERTAIKSEDLMAFPVNGKAKGATEEMSVLAGAVEPQRENMDALPDTTGHEAESVDMSGSRLVVKLEPRVDDV